MRSQLVENGDSPGPAAGSGADLHREAAHHETLRRQHFEIVQLLDVAIADLAAGTVALPDDGGVLALREAVLGVDERRVPTPAIGAGDAHAALQEIERRLAAHAAAARDIIRLAVGFAGGGVDQHDFERLERMIDAFELGLDVVGGDDIAIREMPEVQLDCRLEAPLQRHLVDGDGALAAIHGRRIVIRRIEMRAAVGGERNPFDRPAFAVRQIVDAKPWENFTTSGAVCWWFSYLIFGP